MRYRVLGDSLGINSRVQTQLGNSDSHFIISFLSLTIKCTINMKRHSIKETSVLVLPE